MRESSVPRWAVQDGFDLRFDWGVGGIERLGAHVRAFVIVDVLRFTTTVETATTAGLVVHPFAHRSDAAAARAAELGAVLANGTGAAEPSLSPRSMARLPPGTAVLLPSPNGAQCTLAAAGRSVPVVAACLRNASAVAAALDGLPRPLGEIACGELWRDGSLQPALEDVLGAGAVLARARGSLSPEAAWAAATHARFAHHLRESLRDCASGRALVERGLGADVDWAGEADVSRTLPRLVDGAFREIGV